MTKMMHYQLHVSHLWYKTVHVLSRCMLMKLQEFSAPTDKVAFPLETQCELRSTQHWELWPTINCLLYSAIEDKLLLLFKLFSNELVSYGFLCVRGLKVTVATVTESEQDGLI